MSGLTPKPVPLPEKNEKTHHTLFATLTQANPLQAGLIQAAPSLLRRRSELSKGMRVTRLRPSFFCRIQRFIDAGKQLFNRFAVMMFSHADADGHRQRLVFANRTGGSPPPVSARGRSANGAKKAETLLHPSDKFYLRGRPTFPEYERAPAGPHRLLMAVNIINALEMIDID